MRKALFLFALVCLVTSLLYPQAAVRTEMASNIYTRRTTSGTDTLNKSVGLTGQAGSGVESFLHGIILTGTLTGDTVRIKDGYRTVFEYIGPAAPLTYPIEVEFDVHTDTLVVSLLHGASSTGQILTVWRRRY